MVASIFECGQTVNIESHARHEAFSVAHAAFSGLSGSSDATFGSGVAPEGPCDHFSLRGEALRLLERHTTKLLTCGSPPKEYNPVGLTQLFANAN